MKFGFCIMADIDEIGFFSFIENLAMTPPGSPTAR